MFEETREYLKKIELPQADAYDMPSSELRFPEGAAFRTEVPTVDTAEAVGALLQTAAKNGIVINRVTETYGIFRHAREEIKEYCRLCHDYGAELLMSTGPRATYGWFAFYLDIHDPGHNDRAQLRRYYSPAGQQYRHFCRIVCFGCALYRIGAELPHPSIIAELR
jgi:hypothetical protein